MCYSSHHIKWLVDTGERLSTMDGKEIEIWEFKHEDDDVILFAWATHFRNHYCLDTEIETRRGKETRSEFLRNACFPSETESFGPAIRAGDFGEILVADYLAYRLGYHVPRVRWMLKPTPNESTKGNDVIGFQFADDTGCSPNDELFIIEVKTRFSQSGGNSLQNAIDDSSKDDIRLAESLNLIRQKSIDHKYIDDANQVIRFQNPVDQEYQIKYGASFLVDIEYFDKANIPSSNCEQIRTSKGLISHPHRDSLALLVIRGDNMMKLVHELYRRAADEA